MANRGHSSRCTGWPPHSRSTLDPSSEGEQCAEARPHAGRCWQLSSGGGGPAAAQVPSPRSRPGSSAPGAVTGRGRTARRVVAGREGVRTSARPVVALSASSGPPWGCPSNRSSGRPVSRRPVSRRPGHPGVRTDRPLVSAALPPRDPRRAGLWSGSVGRAAPAGRSESTCPVSAGGVVACPHRAGRKGRGRRWPCLPRTTVDRSQGRRLPGVPAAAPPGRRADRGCWSRARVPAGWRGSMGQSRCSQAPAGRPGLVAGVMPGHGPGPRGGDHAGWSLGSWWSRVFQLRRAHSVRWGAACGRSAAAAREERCPLAADRSLTSENSGGRDRV
jgi:hypothetical protein